MLDFETADDDVQSAAFPRIEIKEACGNTRLCCFEARFTTPMSTQPIPLEAAMCLVVFVPVGRKRLYSRPAASVAPKAFSVGPRYLRFRELRHRWVDGVAKKEVDGCSRGAR